MGVGQSYDSLREGRVIGRVGVSVSETDVEALDFAVSPADGAGADTDGAVRPSAAMALTLRAIMALDVIPPGGVLVGHRLSFREPLAVGEELDVEVLVARAWESRGRPFATLRMTLAGGGAVTCVDEMTAIWPAGDSTMLQRLPSMSAGTGRVVTQAQVERYAQVSHDRNPLHLDEDFAARGPFGERVVHGPIPAGVLLDEWSATHSELTGTGAVVLGFRSPLRPGEPYETRIDDPDGLSRVVTCADRREVATLSFDRTGSA